MMMRMMAHTSLYHGRLALQIQLVAVKYRKRASDMLAGTIAAIRRIIFLKINLESRMDEAEAVVIEEEGGEIVDGAMTEAVGEEASKIVEVMAIHNHLMNNVIMVTVNHRKAHQNLPIPLRTTTTTTAMQPKTNTDLSSHTLKQATLFLHSSSSSSSSIYMCHNSNTNILNNTLLHPHRNMDGQIWHLRLQCQQVPT
jgi:hypothetical protein